MAPFQHIKYLFVPSTSNPDALDDVLPTNPPALFLSSLPTEILRLIFTELSQLDGVCFALTSTRMYAIYRTLNWGLPRLTLPCPIASLRLETMGVEAFEQAVERWQRSVLQRTKYTRQLPLCHLSFSRNCQLHHHIRCWMPPNFHYCKTCGMFAEWWQPNPYRCPCKEPLREVRGREVDLEKETVPMKESIWDLGKGRLWKECRRMIAS